MEFIRQFKPPTRPDDRKSGLIYVSRSKLPAGKGKPIGEVSFETALREAGYTVFHPQEHDLYTQLSVYDKAEKLIFCDGGALHSCILLPDLSADVAIIARRQDVRWDNRGIANQFVGYGKPFTWIDHVQYQYTFGMNTWESLSVIDWAAVVDSLVSSGFVSPRTMTWSQAELESCIDRSLTEFVAAINGQPDFLHFLKKHKNHGE